MASPLSSELSSVPATEHDASNILAAARNARSSTPRSIVQRPTPSPAPIPAPTAREQRLQNRNRVREGAAPIRTYSKPQPSGPALTDRRTRRGYCFRADRLKNGRISKAWNKDIVATRKSQGMERPASLCYRRATINCLLNIPRMVNFLNLNHEDCRHDHSESNPTGCLEDPENHEHCTLCRLIDLSYAYWTTDVNGRDDPYVTGLDEAIENSRDLARFINIQEQQDAHDFLTQLIVAIRNNEHEQPQNWSVNESLDQLFSLTVDERRTYPCKHVNTGTNTSTGLLLGVHREGASNDERLEDLIDDQFTLPHNGLCQHIDCGALREAGGSTEVVEAALETTITHAPQILAISLNRVYWGRGGRRGDQRVLLKQKRRVIYPELLDISPHFQGKTKTKTKTKIQYRLDGVVSHRGDTPAAGHYMAVVRGPDRTLYHINDARTKNLGDGSSKKARTYLFEPENESRLGYDSADAALLFYSKV